MLNSTLVRRVNITDTLYIFQICPDAGVPDFLPGQYVAIGLTGAAPRIAGSLDEEKPARPDKIVKRAYSVGSAPHEKEGLEFYIALVPDGALTPRLACLAEGDRLFIAPKIVGTFVCGEVPAEKNLIFVATGTGIAPYISMVRCPETWTEGRKIKIVHGVRYMSDFAYREELMHLAQDRPEFEYYPVVSRDDPNWEGERGYVQRFFSENLLSYDPAEDHIFLCGNPAMIEQLEEVLIAKGYSVHSKKNPGNLHIEKYW